ncbi:Uncharacterised protein [Serratia quinivorans]|uniref:hypothetical protein n=1 Tax=Serratia quinivorans TaxID=137545 RepID=UPI002177FC40|nr:hypothetical protein [Serratia quinivorans]CAI2061956.1 Uncharacterised protein [Serratia quinivorans]
MTDKNEVPKEGLYVSTIPGGERLVVVDVNVVEDEDDEEGDDIFFLVTAVNEGDEEDMSAPSWEFDSTEWQEHVEREKLEFVG